jgi:hypothetical protein
MSDESAEPSKPIDVRRLKRVERLQLGAAIVLAITLFLPWYSTDPANASANVKGRRGDVTAWIAHPVLRWFLLAAVAGALLSAWQTITAHLVFGHPHTGRPLDRSGEGAASGFGGVAVGGGLGLGRST